MASLYVAVLFLAFSFVTADLEKLSNSLIRNGSVVYSFDRAIPGWYSVVFRSDIPYTDTRICMHLFEPLWADSGVDYDSTPDINIIGDLESRLYFSGFHVEQRKGVLGVAKAGDLWEDWFTTPLLPLLSGTASLSHPSLVQSPDGDLQLFYYNSTGPLGLGSVETVQLTEDGMSVADETVSIFDASLDWEGGSLTSMTAFHQNGMYYVIYSGADGVTIGAARSSNIAGPYEKRQLSVSVNYRSENSNFLRKLQTANLSWDEEAWPQI